MSNVISKVKKVGLSFIDNIKLSFTDLKCVKYKFGDILVHVDTSEFIIITGFSHKENKFQAKSENKMFDGSAIVYDLDESFLDSNFKIIDWANNE